MNTIREIEQINKKELEQGIAGTSASWHAQYEHAAWIYVGNLDHSLTEGDVICFLSQFGEVEDIHLVRDKDTGKSKGFGFLKYEDSRSCILAIDNLIGVQVRRALPFGFRILCLTHFLDLRPFDSFRPRRKLSTTETFRGKRK